MPQVLTGFFPSQLFSLQSFWACSHGKRGYSGVTTYCSNAWAPISCEVDLLENEDGVSSPTNETSNDNEPSSSLTGEGRILVTDFGPQAFVLINVYVPNAGGRPDRPRLAEKLRFLSALKAKCETLAASGREILLVGDFNVSADPRDVHPRIGLEKAYSAEERELFLSFLREETGIFIDMWRQLHPDGEGVYTVWDEKTSARAFNEGLRIDFILATEKLASKITRCDVLGADMLPPKWSDHAGILVEIDTTDCIKAPQPHPPCKEWVKLNKRFNDPSQKSILSMFGKRKAPAGDGEKAAGEGKSKTIKSDAEKLIVDSRLEEEKRIKESS